VPDFQTVSDFRPLGDQPQAIEKLVTGLNQGLKHQTLLGATGTGKSLGHDDLVFVVEERAGKRTPRVLPVGSLVDSLMDGAADRLHFAADTAVLDTADTPARYYAQSFDPASSRVDLYPIQSFTRHSAPAAMYKLITRCGREAILTGDHNLWVLRDGKLQLINTADARTSDFMPVPEKLLAEGNLKELDILPLLAGKRMFVEAPKAIARYIEERGTQDLVGALSEGGISGYNKVYAIRHQGRGRGIEAGAFQSMLQKTGNLAGGWNPVEAEVGSKRSRQSLQAAIELTPAVLRLFGYYIAEGNCQIRSGYFILANRSPTVRSAIEESLNHLGVRFAVRPSSDYQVSSAPLANVLATLCGTDARSKRLPAFWPQLSDEDLGHLLRAYFDGDGTVAKASAVTATTASRQLAYELAYALLRFGIWARIGRKWKRATNSSHSGDWYYQVTVSGQADLQRFCDNIGFSIGYKQEKLAAQSHHRENSNVDLVPGVGAQLHFLRGQIGVTAEELGKLAGFSRSAVQFIETGKRSPQRASLRIILAALQHLAQAVRPSEAWWQTWAALNGLCAMRWSRISSVEPVQYSHPHVYDFTVPGPETFLAGSGGFFIHNTFVMAKIIEATQRPTLVLAHNKTLAAQLYQEFKDFFPSNAVEYFVSYYDFYQPEAYIPRTDLYIEKDADINEEIDKLRHAATRALFERRDVIIVASVSCIFGLGSPEEYGNIVLTLKKGKTERRQTVLRRLIDSHYTRNDMSLERGTFRVRGDTLEIVPAYEDMGLRIEFWGDEIERIQEFDPLTGEVLADRIEANIYPAKHFITSEEKLAAAIVDIQAELEQRVAELKAEDKLVEAQRLEQRTRYDLEMLQETGYCSGVENYSRHLSRRQPGDQPWTLLDYFPGDFLLMVDESHITLPQVRGMFGGDHSRKVTLIDYGFRLPSAADNRPLTFPEFESHVKQAIYVSATPAVYEHEHSQQIVEQIIRPTGLVDPSIEIKPTEGQIDDLVEQIRARTEKGHRTLITTMRTKFAEQIADYLKEVGIKAHYIHHEIDTLERVEILRDLRLGIYDVLVGINLLREGLDLPEVSLVAILDADKEGFLRSRDSLIQTMGRAARHAEGHVIMYADVVTRSMQAAIEETYRRREIQMKYNQEHGIEPASIQKQVRDLTDRVRAVAETRADYEVSPDGEIALSKDEIARIIKELESQMKSAAKLLEFEKAAAFRDQIVQLRRAMD
jgi:excinuclease ABC B subunit